MAGESSLASAARSAQPTEPHPHPLHGGPAAHRDACAAPPLAAVSHPDALISHLFHLCDPAVQAAFEPSHLTREWLDSLPVPPGCAARPEPSSNAQWALVEQWRIAAGTIRYYAQFATQSWYEHQYWLQQQQQEQQANSLRNPPWGSAFEHDVRAEQYRLFGSAPLTERVAAAAAADAAFLGAFGSGADGLHAHANQTQAHAQAQVAGWLAPNGHVGREELDDDDHDGGDNDDDDDDDYEDEEDEDDDDGGADGREFSFPIDLAALAKSAGMPFAAGGVGVPIPTGGGASTYEDIVNRLAQAQQQAQQHAASAGAAAAAGAGAGAGTGGAFTPAQLLQLQSAGALIESEGAGASGADGGPLTAAAAGILSDSSDPLSLGPASLPSLMAAISELEQCVARLSLEASEARSLQRRMRDELGNGGGAGMGAGPDGDDFSGDEAEEERVRAALEKKKMRNKKKKDKKKAKAAAAAEAAAAAAAAAALLHEQAEEDTAAADTMSATAPEQGVAPSLGDEIGQAAATLHAVDSDHSGSHEDEHDREHGYAGAGDHQPPPKKEDGELIKALQSVSMLDRRADEYRERLRVLKEQIHHHAALADALAASSAAPTVATVPASARPGAQQHYHHHQHQHHHPASHPSAGGGPVLGSLNATVASATVPLYFDGAHGEQGQVGEYDDNDDEDGEEEDDDHEEELYEEEEEEEEEEEV